MSFAFQGMVGIGRFNSRSVNHVLAHLSAMSPVYTRRQRKVGAAPHRGEPNRPVRIQGEANARREPTKTKAPQANRCQTDPKPRKTSKRSQAPTKPPATQSPPKPCAAKIPKYEFNTHILEISKKPTYNPEHQARKATQQGTRNREPSRQRGEKWPYPSARTPCGRRGPHDRRHSAMPITVRQETRTCRDLSRFSGRQAGPAR